VTQTMLAARSDFSLGESILDAEAIIAEAKRVGENVVAITDTMSVTSMVDFTNRAKKAEIKPIIGCRLRLVDDVTWKKVRGVKGTPPDYYLTWYVLSEKGLTALYKLLSRANAEDRFYMNAKIGFDDLFDALSSVTADDVAIASSDTQSAIHHKDAVAILSKISATVRVYISVCPVNTPFWDKQNKVALEIAKTLKLPIILTRPVLYKPGDADANEIMGAITRNVKLTDGWHWSNHVRDLHAMTYVEFANQCLDLGERLNKRFGIDYTATLHTVANDELVDAAKFQWSKQPVSLPVMAPDEFALVRSECTKGWKLRFEDPIFGHKPTPAELTEVYIPRLKYELGVLRDLKFSGYFLLVQDVVQFAKSNGILVGPGRGSVGGSLVAYLMGITECDPIRFGLLFERFINPDRIDLPDADLDFMSERRHEIIDYLVKKYGDARVSGVSNFNALASASAIRDVAKAIGIHEFEYTCSKLVPKLHGQPVGLEKAAKEVGEIDAYRIKHPVAWENSTKLAGVMRSLATHAAGVVVAGVDLVERGVVERRSGDAIINWDKRIVEDQGLVKMDILGLSTLDQIDQTLKFIFKRHGKKIDISRIPLDDPKVLENFAKGMTTGVFQFESGGMRRLLRELGRDGNITFDDITAATALYRPGPMESGMMDSYWKRKQGLELVEYDHPDMEPVLRPTFGVPIYQEQIMQIARVMAGYSGADADKLRKIMGKKMPEEMAKERDKFVDGAKAGYVEVELEDGTKRKLHRSEKFKVIGSTEVFTVEEIFQKGLEIIL
jgi:DNA polymerase III subunit alpha